MIAVLSLLGLLLAGFALDAGTSDDAPPEEDPQPQDRAEAADTGDMLDMGEDWDSLYGQDAADRLYGTAGFDDLFAEDQTDPGTPQDAEDTGLLVLGAGDAVSAGPGSDSFAVAAGDGPPPEIADYDPGMDRLVIAYDATDGSEPSLSVTETGDEEGRIAEIRLDGALVCRVTLPPGAPPLTAADLALVPSDSI